MFTDNGKRFFAKTFNFFFNKSFGQCKKNRYYKLSKTHWFLFNIKILCIVIKKNNNLQGSQK